MNKVLGNVLTFVGGTVLGFLTAKVVYTKYYENLVEVELNSIRDAYIKAMDEVVADRKVAKAIKPSIKAAKEFVRQNKSAIIRDEVDQYEGNKYNNVINEYTEMEEEEDVGDEYLDDTAYGDPVEEFIPNPIPYLISERQFGLEESDYDKISLDFYTEDNILVDENSEELIQEDVINTIGKAALEALSTCGPTGTIVYVRNEKYRTDYEIGTVDDFYKEENDPERTANPGRKQYNTEVKKVEQFFKPEVSIVKTAVIPAPPVKVVIKNPALDKGTLSPREAFDLRQQRSEKK